MISEMLPTAFSIVSGFAASCNNNLLLNQNDFITSYIKIFKEKKLMKDIFPAYLKYADRTKRLIPLVY